MKSLSAALVSAALLVSGSVAQITLNTPNPPTVCVPVQLSWTGGTAPFFLAINPGGQTGATALQQYSDITSSPFTWSTNITAGTSVSFEITDSTGVNGQTAPVTIQSGPDTSCLTSSSGSTTGSTTGTTTGGSTGTTTGASTTGASTTGTSGTTATTGTTGASTKSSTTGTAAASTTSAAGSSGTSGALSNVASMGVVSVFAAVAAAFLA